MAVSASKYCLAALGLLLAGCGARQATLVRPMPVVVQPSGEPWGVEVGLDIGKAVQLDVVNTSARPVRLLWDECVFVDGTQQAHRMLVASNWKHRDFSAQVPAQLAPGSRLRETLHPITSSRERVASLLPPPPGLGTRTWVRMKKWLFFQWSARVPDPPLETISVFLVLEDHRGRKTLMAPYAVGGSALTALPTTTPPMTHLSSNLHETVR